MNELRVKFFLNFVFFSDYSEKVKVLFSRNSYKKTVPHHNTDSLHFQNTTSFQSDESCRSFVSICWWCQNSSRYDKSEVVVMITIKLNVLNNNAGSCWESVNSSIKLSDSIYRKLSGKFKSWKFTWFHDHVRIWFHKISHNQLFEHI